MKVQKVCPGNCHSNAAQMTNKGVASGHSDLTKGAVVIYEWTRGAVLICPYSSESVYTTHIQVVEHRQSEFKLAPNHENDLIKENRCKLYFLIQETIVH